MRRIIAEYRVCQNTFCRRRRITTRTVMRNMPRRLATKSKSTWVATSTTQITIKSPRLPAKRGVVRLTIQTTRIAQRPPLQPQLPQRQARRPRVVPADQVASSGHVVFKPGGALPSRQVRRIRIMRARLVTRAPEPVTIWKLQVHWQDQRILTQVVILVEVDKILEACRPEELRRLHPPAQATPEIVKTEKAVYHEDNQATVWDL